MYFGRVTAKRYNFSCVSAHTRTERRRKGDEWARRRGVKIIRKLPNWTNNSICYTRASTLNEFISSRTSLRKNLFSCEWLRIRRTHAHDVLLKFHRKGKHYFRHLNKSAKRCQCNRKRFRNTNASSRLPSRNIFLSRISRRINFLSEVARVKFVPNGLIIYISFIFRCNIVGKTTCFVSSWIGFKIHYSYNSSLRAYSVN